MPKARAAWAKALEAIGPAELVGRVRRYAAEDHDLRSGKHGARAFERWLSGEVWRAWGGLAGSGVAAATVELACAVPVEIVAKLKAQAREPIGGYLAAAGWRASDQTILTRTAIAAERLIARVGKSWLEAHGVRIEQLSQAGEG